MSENLTYTAIYEELTKVETLLESLFNTKNKNMQAPDPLNSIIQEDVNLNPPKAEIDDVRAAKLTILIKVLIL